MTPRTVAIMFVIALVTSAAAIYGMSNRVQYELTNFDGQRLFPGLLEEAAKVEKVEVLQNGQPFTFEKKGDTWVLSQSDGYQVHGNLVAKLIFSVANLEILEPKTADPARHAELNLGDPSVKENKAQLVTLLSGDGEKMAEIVVGRANYFLPETTTGGMYVRRPGEDQAWLVRGLVDIGVERRDWLVRDIIDIDIDDIVHAEVRRPDGEVQIVEPKQGVTGNFAFANMPEGRKLKSEYAPRNIAAVASGFVLNDVRKNENVPFDPSKAYNVTYESKDGIVADMAFWQEEKTQYLRIKADYKGSDPESDAAKTVEAINKRAAGWTYIIPEYQYEQVSKPFEEVTEPADKPGPG
jgi:hypothetical protein